MRLLFLLPPLLASHATLAETVTDAMGRGVEIPDDPSRIVVLHEPLLGVPLADFGVDPVGSYGRADDGSSLMAADFYASILGDDAPDPAPRGIGAVGDIDLERLRALSPDLIIGTELDADKADQLTAIAPVYLQASSSGKVRGFETEKQLAALLDRTDAFEDRRAEYQEKLDRLKPIIPPGQSYLAVIVHDKINLVGEMSGAIQAIEDLGYNRLPLKADGPDNALGSTFAVPISSEAFGRMNPDLLVILSSYAGASHDEAGTRAQLDRVMPGWERFLKPAREGRIVWMDSTKVATPSIASAEHALDAIEAWSAQASKN
ncbi:ABC transporter substrate-binding protein [Paracoccus methylarcula]|uniref:ABC transporter substrate-binding protein n=1 Tax=Paracoccus methylarcula TaxID=72022 RepID=A0A422QZ90_9RHOB|nr:ABC transporter substrate-binding protein [Paracoccus methylarcula]RNF35307.1 ABC transporter substrate-binding protein [Paracoccus methylarcula]